MLTFLHLKTFISSYFKLKIDIFWLDSILFLKQPCVSQCFYQLEIKIFFRCFNLSVFIMCVFETDKWMFLKLINYPTFIYSKILTRCLPGKIHQKKAFLTQIKTPQQSPLEHFNNFLQKTCPNFPPKWPYQSFRGKRNVLSSSFNLIFCVELLFFGEWKLNVLMFWMFFIGSEWKFLFG